MTPQGVIPAQAGIFFGLAPWERVNSRAKLGPESIIELGSESFFVRRNSFDFVSIQINCQQTFLIDSEIMLR